MFRRYKFWGIPSGWPRRHRAVQFWYKLVRWRWERALRRYLRLLLHWAATSGRAGMAQSSFYGSSFFIPPLFCLIYAHSGNRHHVCNGPSQNNGGNTRYRLCSPHDSEAPIISADFWYLGGTLNEPVLTADGDDEGELGDDVKKMLE